QMIARLHFPDAELRQLLDLQTPSPDGSSDGISGQHAELLRHVESCETCQQRLETLSLGQITWETARRMLQDDSIDDAIPPQESTTASQTPFLQPTTHPDSLGTFGRYEIMEILGRGGMGIVMRGFDPALNRLCAIKVLAPELASSAAARRRFSREAKSAAAVVHQHVIPIQTVDEENGLPYLIMPVVEGCSLEQRVRGQGPMPIIEIIRVAAQIADGLSAAHANGLVHRDIKPANVLLENGVERVQITDFGLARAADDASMTRSGIIAGTPQYMSPEQAHGDPIDHRSDLFSLGGVIYFMCTGRCPFRAESTMGVLSRIIRDVPKRPREINADVPAWLDEIVMRLLSKSPHDRIQSAEEISRLLQAWLAHLHAPDSVDAPENFAPSPHISSEIAVDADRQSDNPKEPLSAPVSNAPQRGTWTLGSILWWMLTAAALIGVVWVAGVIYLDSQKGTIRIETNAEHNVPVRIRRGDTIAQQLTVSAGGTTTRIAAGEYVIEIDTPNQQDENQYQIVADRVVLKKGQQWIARIESNFNTDTTEKTAGSATDTPMRDNAATIADAMPQTEITKGQNANAADRVAMRYNGETLAVWQERFENEANPMEKLSAADAIVTLLDAKTIEGRNAIIKLGGQLVQRGWGNQPDRYFHFDGNSSFHPVHWPKTSYPKLASSWARFVLICQSRLLEPGQTKALDTLQGFIEGQSTSECLFALDILKRIGKTLAENSVDVDRVLRWEHAKNDSHQFHLLLLQSDLYEEHSDPTIAAAFANRFEMQAQHLLEWEKENSVSTEKMVSIANAWKSSRNKNDIPGSDKTSAMLFGLLVRNDDSTLFHLRSNLSDGNPLSSDEINRIRQYYDWAWPQWLNAAKDWMNANPNAWQKRERMQQAIRTGLLVRNQQDPGDTAEFETWLLEVLKEKSRPGDLLKQIRMGKRELTRADALEFHLFLKGQLPKNTFTDQEAYQRMSSRMIPEIIQSWMADSPVTAKQPPSKQAVTADKLIRHRPLLVLRHILTQDSVKINERTIELIQWVDPVLFLAIAADLTGQDLAVDARINAVLDHDSFLRQCRLLLVDRRSIRVATAYNLLTFIAQHSLSPKSKLVDLTIKYE
ncbi:MAG: serine/threonine-protein kinase, partial [Planctomycetota bacterium]